MAPPHHNHHTTSTRAKDSPARVALHHSCTGLTINAAGQSFTLQPGQSFTLGPNSSLDLHFNPPVPPANPHPHGNPQTPVRRSAPRPPPRLIKDKTIRPLPYKRPAQRLSNLLSPPPRDREKRHQAHAGRVGPKRPLRYCHMPAAAAPATQQPSLEEERKDQADWSSQWIQRGQAQQPTSPPPAPTRPMSLAEQRRAQVEWSKQWMQESGDSMTDEGDTEDEDMEDDEE